MKKTGYDDPSKGKFTIIGHSLGCYIATHYAMREHDKIDEMIHLSPAAIGEKPKDYQPWEYVEKQTNFCKRQLMKLAWLVWDFNLSPVIPFKMFGYWPGRALQKGWL
jgi:pimeloyl-ACP methyl ester carboxylesterase